MTLTLYFHPLSSYCQKVLVALYENDTPFEKRLVNLGDAEDAAAFKALWPNGKFPLLRDEGEEPDHSGVEHHHRVSRSELSRQDIAHSRRWRHCLENAAGGALPDLCVQAPMQAIVGDRLRPKEARDPIGVARAKSQLRTALDVLDKDMADTVWAIGDRFSMADCAAAPALYYANLVMPFADTHKNAAAYLERLMQRPSFARAVEEAEPFRHMFPRE